MEWYAWVFGDFENQSKKLSSVPDLRSAPERILNRARVCPLSRNASLGASNM